MGLFNKKRSEAPIPEASNVTPPEFQSINVYHNHIVFTRPAYCFGQRIVCARSEDGKGSATEFGVVVGMRRGRYTWIYTIARCSPLTNESEEVEFDQSELG